MGTAAAVRAWGRRASPTKPEVRRWRLPRRRHASGARGGGAAREARARARACAAACREGSRPTAAIGSGRGQTYARPGICTRIDARVGARRERRMGNTVGSAGRALAMRARAAAAVLYDRAAGGSSGSLGKKYTLGVSITAPSRVSPPVARSSSGGRAGGWRFEWRRRARYAQRLRGAALRGRWPKSAAPPTPTPRARQRRPRFRPSRAPCALRGRAAARPPPAAATRSIDARDSGGTAHVVRAQAGRAAPRGRRRRLRRRRARPRAVPRPARLPARRSAASPEAAERRRREQHVQLLRRHRRPWPAAAAPRPAAGRAPEAAGDGLLERRVRGRRRRRRRRRLDARPARSRG